MCWPFNEILIRSSPHRSNFYKLKLPSLFLTGPSNPKLYRQFIPPQLLFRFCFRRCHTYLFHIISPSGPKKSTFLHFLYFLCKVYDHLTSEPVLNWSKFMQKYYGTHKTTFDARTVLVWLLKNETSAKPFRIIYLDQCY